MTTLCLGAETPQADKTSETLIKPPQHLPPESFGGRSVAGAIPAHLPAGLAAEPLSEQWECSQLHVGHGKCLMTAGAGVIPK